MKHYLRVIGNYHAGGMQAWKYNETIFMRCMCDGQFDDRYDIRQFDIRCRDRSIIHWPYMGRYFCPGWREEHVQLLEWFNFIDLQKLDSHIARSNSSVIVIYHAVGLHIGMQPELTIHKFYQPIVNSIKSQSKQVIYIVASLHTPGAHKPREYLATQGLKAVTHYNGAIRTWANTMNVPFFTTQQMTANLTSVDGTHYGLRANILLAQMFLNVVAQTVS